MVRRFACIILALCILTGLNACAPRYEKYQADFMGLFDTYMVILGYSQSEAEFTRYAEIIYDRMTELNQLYDIYNAYEGVNNLHTVNANAGIAPVEVDRDIIDLLLVAKEGYYQTDGLVNIALGAVLRIWHDYRAAGIADPETASVPPMEMLLAAQQLTDIEDLIIDEENNTVFLRKAGMSLDVGAIAKGYAADLAIKAAVEAGAESLLMNAGGNITAVGKPIDGTRVRWGVGIQNPNMIIDMSQNILDTVFVNDMTVSCSGDYQRYYLVDGVRYSHIIDPATLMPASLYRQVSVLHESPGIAELLSTALFIIPQEDGAALAAEYGAEILWIYPDDSQKATDGYTKISKNLGNYSAVDK